MRVRFDFGAGVRHGDGQPAVPHHRQIDDVVADKCSFAGLQSCLAQYFFERGQLVLNALVNILQLQIASAEGNSF